MSDFTVNLRFTADGAVQIVQAARQSSEAVAGIGDAARDAGAQTQRGMEASVKAMGSFKAESLQTQSVVASLVGTLGGLAAVKGFASSFIAAADSVGQMQSRLKLATADTREYEAVLGRIQEVARNSYKSIADVSEVFLQSAGPMRELGFSTQETLDLTEAMSLALVVSGANAQTSSSAITQLGQAMQLGTLRGQEFNTVVAAAPRFADALAASLGKTRAELKQMADAGELTIDQVAAVSSQLELLRAETESMPTTVEDAMIRARDAFGLWAAGTNEASGATDILVRAIDALSRNIETVMTAALVGVTVATGHLIKQGQGWIASLLAQQSAARASAAALVEQTAAQAAEAREALASAAAARANAQAKLAQAAAGKAAALASVELGAAEKALALAQTQATAATQAASAATVAARGTMLSFGNAVNVAMAALVGWQIGTWARNEFDAVRVAAAYLIAFLDQQWQSAKLAAMAVWEGIRAAIVGQINLIRTAMAEMIGWYATAIEKLDMTGLGSRLSAPLRDVEAQLRPTESAWGRFVAKLGSAKGAYEETSRSIWQIAKELADYERAAGEASRAQEEFARTGAVNNRTAKAAIDALNKSVAEQVAKMREQTATYGQGRAAAAEYEKAQKLAAAATIRDVAAREAYIAAIEEQYGLLIREARAFDALVAGKKANTKADKEWESETKRLAQTQAAFADTLLQMEAALAGPVRAAQIEYERKLTDLDQKLEAGEITLTQYYRALELVEEGHRRAARSAEMQEDVVGSLSASYAEELRLAMLSDEQRRVAIATTNALSQARRDAGRELTAAEEQAIRAIVARGEAELRAADLSRQAAEQSAQFWWDFSGQLAGAMREGTDSVKSMFRRMLDDLKRQLLQSAIFGLIRQLFGGATAGGGGGFWSSLAGAFGGGGAGSGGGFWAGLASMFMGGGGGNAAGTAGSVVQMGSQLYSSFASSAQGANGNFSLLQMGRNIWQGFSQGSAGAVGMGSNLFGTYYGSQFAGPLPAGMQPGFNPGMGTYAAGLAGAYYGFTNRGSSNGSMGSILGGISYGALGLGAAGAIGAGMAGGVGAMAGGATSAFASLGGAAAIPIIGWIAAIAALVDLISGGRLFGTRYKPESATSTISISDEGASAAASVREVRQRSLFRGRQWRTREVDAGDEALNAASEWWDAMMDVNTRAARALQAEAPALLEQAIRTVQEYDSKGKVKATKMFLDVLGRAFEVADAEEAMLRAGAEQIIHTIDQILGYTVEGMQSGGVGPGIGPGAGIGPGEWELPGIGDTIEKTLQLQGEASAIAERWRDDAETLMAGAQFLLAAAGDIVRGVALLGDGPGSLLAVTDLMEELRLAGESLADTYQRVYASTRLLEQAYAMMGQASELAREEFVRFSASFVEAAGGLERASGLWQDYFQRYYTAEERAIFALQQATENALSQFADIGLDFADFGDDEAGQRFRAMFEELLPSLSAEALVEWLEAANALGIVIDAEAALAQARGQVADTTAALAELMAQVRGESASVAEQLARLGMSELAIELREIEQGLAAAITAAEDLGATEADLAEIRQLAADQAELAIARARIQLDQLLDGLRFDDALAGMSEFDRQLAQLNRQWDENAANAAALGATQEDLAEIEALRAAALGRLMAAEAERAAAEAAREWEQWLRQWEDNAARLRELMAGLAWDDSLRGMTDYERRVAEVNRRFAEHAATVRELGGGVRELTALERYRANALADLAAAEAARQAAEIGGVLDPLRWDASLRGLSDYDRRVAETNRRFDEYARTLTEAGASAEELAELETYRQLSLMDIVDERYERELAWIKRLMDFRDSLLLDSKLTTLTPQEQLTEAQRQYEQTLAAAMGGDESARGSLDRIAREFLNQARGFWGSAAPYQAIFDQVLGDVGELIDLGTGGAVDVQAQVAQALSTIASSPLFQGGEDGQAVLVDVAPVTASIDSLRGDVRDQTRELTHEIRSLATRLDRIEANTSRTATNTRELADSGMGRTV